MTVINLVYVHIGTELPACLIDSLYQTLLINGYGTKIYVILSDDVVNDFNKRVSTLNLSYYSRDDHFDFQNVVQVIPLSILEMRCDNDINFTNYKNIITEKFSGVGGFRGGFWVSTTSRFYYIYTLMAMFQLKNVFHIENDIMMYESLRKVYDTICEYYISSSIDKICMVQDAPNRVIPSLLFFPNVSSLSNLTQYITNELGSSATFINDMDILGRFDDKWQLPFLPDENNLIFDGAALGQYLGGVDYRNLLGDVDYNNLTTEQKLVIYDNPSRGFVNETAGIKADQYTFSKCNVISDKWCVPVKIPIMCDNENVKKIVNLHIHSKQLYQFSSVSDLQYQDIISGDRILGLCDFVLLTNEIYTFHKNIEKYAKDVIVIKDFTRVNFQLLNGYFRGVGKPVVKIFIYTHMLDNFKKYIFPHLDETLEYIFYFHNSDHAVTDDHKDIFLAKNVRKVYAQNIDTTINSDKITLLPIGMANSMWKHGDLLSLYKVISETYLLKKTSSIYVNINPATYRYRKNVLEKIIEYGNLDVSTGKPYVEYLAELSTHRFCLCLRGNGIDTHRFWESLYLGVIPVIINNKTTRCKNFVRYLRKLEIPFYEILEDDLDVVFEKYTIDFFNETLYKEIITKTKTSIYNISALRMDFYDGDNELM